MKLTKAQVALGVGTTTGGYLLLSDKSRKVWKKRGPFLGGESVKRLTYSRKGKKLYATTLTDGVFVSADFGRTWKPINRGLHVRKVWALLTLRLITFISLEKNMPIRRQVNSARFPATPR